MDTRPGARAAAAATGIVGTVTVADPTVAGQHKTKDLTHTGTRPRIQVQVDTLPCHTGCVSDTRAVEPL